MTDGKNHYCCYTFHYPVLWGKLNMCMHALLYIWTQLKWQVQLCTAVALFSVMISSWNWFLYNCRVRGKGGSSATVFLWCRNCEFAECNPLSYCMQSLQSQGKTDIVFVYLDGRDLSSHCMLKVPVLVLNSLDYDGFMYSDSKNSDFNVKSVTIYQFFSSEIAITFSRLCCESDLDRARESHLQTEQQTSQRSKKMCSEFTVQVTWKCN